VNAVILLALACIHEFSWQVFPWALQGQWRAVTQWLVIAWLALSVARLGRNKLLSAACLATTIMSSTTAVCSAAWMINPWELQAGTSQCSQWLSFPTMFVSVLVALLALRRWKTVREGCHER